MEAFADPIEITLLSDREEGRGSGCDLGADLVQLLFGDPGILCRLADRTDRGSGHATDDGHEEEGTDQNSPQGTPPGSAPGFLMALFGGRMRVAFGPRDDCVVENLHQPVCLTALQDRGSALSSTRTVELPHRKGGHGALLAFNQPERGSAGLLRCSRQLTTERRMAHAPAAPSSSPPPNVTTSPHRD